MTISYIGNKNKTKQKRSLLIDQNMINHRRILTIHYVTRKTKQNKKKHFENQM